MPSSVVLRFGFETLNRSRTAFGTSTAFCPTGLATFTADGLRSPVEACAKAEFPLQTRAWFEQKPEAWCSFNVMYTLHIVRQRLL